MKKTMVPKGRVSRAIYTTTERGNNEFRTWLSSDLLPRFRGSRVNKARVCISANASDSTKQAIPRSLLRFSTPFMVQVVRLKAQSKV